MPASATFASYTHIDSIVLPESANPNSCEISQLWNSALSDPTQVSEVDDVSSPAIAVQPLADNRSSVGDHTTTSHDRFIQALNHNLLVAIAGASLFAGLGWMISNNLILVGAATYAVGNLVDSYFARFAYRHAGLRS